MFSRCIPTAGYTIGWGKKQRQLSCLRKVSEMALPTRAEIQPGMRVRVVEKQNQRKGILTEGIVQRILTKSPSHPHGIKVMLEDGRVGRVQSIPGQ
jgi:uncharacterized repeat protein (TIGR03833 family)